MKGTRSLLQLWISEAWSVSIAVSTIHFDKQTKFLQTLCDLVGKLLALFSKTSCQSSEGAKTRWGMD
jgi:hypothetical protein